MGASIGLDWICLTTTHVLQNILVQRDRIYGKIKILFINLLIISEFTLPGLSIVLNEIFFVFQLC